MKELKALIFILLPICLFGQQNFVHKFNHDGIEREYEIHVPNNYNANQDYPLVINMHGAGSSRDEQRLYSRFNIVADTGNFILVYPQGIEVDFRGIFQRHWNAGFGTGIDDEGFLMKMLDRIIVDYSIDEKRVYSTGMSNGGYMSYFLACTHADRLTAIASVTGSMALNVLSTCDPGENMPVMHIHGTADVVVPFNGPPSIDDVVDFWVRHNGCDLTPTIEMIPDINKMDNATAIKKVYNMCNEEDEVWYFVVDNGGHTWPGTFPIAILGNTCGDFFASTHIWEFFKQFPKNVTSNDEIAKSEILLYPNPAVDYINIEGMDSKFIYVSNIVGQQFKIKRKSKVYEISQLSAGIYFYKNQGRNYSFVKI